LTGTFGCGGGNGDADKTFDGDGYSFTYPGSWSQREGEARAQRTDIQASSFYFGPGEGVDGLTLDVGRIGFPITESNVDTVSDQFAGEVDAMFRLAQGRMTKGPTRLEVGGLPALRFRRVRPHARRCSRSVSSDGAIRRKDSVLPELPVHR
jgi:hypothetical protein